MGRDLRPLADQGDVGVGQHAAPGGDPLCGVAEEAGAVGILPLRLAGREVAADIALRQRAVDGVAQRMDADIRVGMAGKPPIMRHGDAAEHQRPAHLHGMDVEAGAGARQQAGCQGAFQTHDILRVGQLDVIVSAGNDGHRVARGLQQGRIVGDAALARGVQGTQ